MAEDVLRQRAKKAAHRKVTAEKLDAMMEKVFDGTMQVVCKHCHRATPVPMPSLKDLRELIVALEGQVPEPEQRVRVDVTVGFESLTTEQLQAIANGDAEIVEGEWTEAPPELLPAA